jgi:serine protease Do
MIHFSARHIQMGFLLTGICARAQTDAISEEVVRKVDASVVAIQHERAVGSGFVLSADGLILTNGHVVRGDDDENPTLPAQSIMVILHDERKFPAKVLGFSMDPDVALIKIEPVEPLVPVEFANSREARIGQNCFAVGTPIGLKRTFTSGVLSNVERTDLNTEVKVFQTDAAINPGNSGGPLFDREGRVLGVNTYASRGSNNLGFTIPSHVVLQVKESLQNNGRRVRSILPVVSLSELYDELAKGLGVSDGVLVEHVESGSAADKAGLKPGDIIRTLDGQSVTAHTRAQLLDLDWSVTMRKPGEMVALGVRPRNGGDLKS